MNFNSFFIIILFFSTSSCYTGKVTPLADLPSSLKEASAIEKTKNSDLLWTIEDAGNKNNLYALNSKIEIVKNLEIENAQNNDWEDLTSDNFGNIYIGDFGNNSKKRENFTIYKITNPEKATDLTTAEVISFTLPKKMESEDFESFFLYNDYFYIFSKSDKDCKLFKVPNRKGDHEANYIAEVKLDGKHTKVTSADISDDGKTVVLLNHERLWKITDFKSDNFFDGKVKSLAFEHDSQKEGVVFIHDNEVLITDEKTKHEGGKIYDFIF
ncbi:hypothetical protein [Psychroserpens sp. Hel_I_66]|uniref:hypothetical protein n=1 Tax=Psychroserpens sp. Hel_I_66 TaxID=1250004 RepID=UPI0006485B3A|nr:hypothetical protein [Psychroserpens sp. Hel_I_66]